jgi:site-specific DNA-methyltransferase (adenine-specific)
MNYTLHNGDCLEVLRTMSDNSVDAVVTDPPYGLAFMGKKWDYDVPSIQIWQECLRVLKPGGHLLAFAGTRTQHRMAVRIEDAGFEIRDMIAWVYGSGFPKSHDISKAIDKAAGAEREVVGKYIRPDGTDRDYTEWQIHTGQWRYNSGFDPSQRAQTAPATPAAKQWEGWGTALKPALEPITVARKPFTGTVAENVLEWGTGGINVDGCRVGTDAEEPNARKQKSKLGVTINNQVYNDGWVGTGCSWDGTLGRFPANLIHDGSDEVVGFMGESFRFFYCAKASKADRGDGNNHPTVKPTDLMRYLCRLVTPPNGIVLDPFTGSGSTGKAAILEGFQFIGIEREAEYIEIARARIEHALNSKPNTLF